MHQLAIVIPVFKSAYFNACLESIANQTDKRFCVYVGNDASRDCRIDEIVSTYNGRIDITYVKFSENYGAFDLVAHWTRCVKMSGEPWVWLFCDDDVMDNTCVESFYSMLQTDVQPADLYRFDTQIIDGNGELTSEKATHPAIESSIEFCVRRLTGKTFSFVSEYIFSRQRYLETGGFVSFPLAWASDDATWIKFGGKSGIKKIQGSLVFWRRSGLNITATNIGRTEKLRACIRFLNFIDDFFTKNGGYEAVCDKKTFAIYKHQWLKSQKSGALNFNKIHEKALSQFIICCEVLYNVFSTLRTVRRIQQ